MYRTSIYTTFHSTCSATLYIGFFFLLLLSAGVSSLQASNSFKEGYYISQEGDTINGLVKVQPREQLGIKCLFKSDHAGTLQELEPNGILGYGFVGGKVFRSKTLKYTSEVEKLVFFELLLSGRLNLYRYRDRFFLEYGADNTFKELISSTSTTNVGYRVFKESNREYVDVLSEAMGDCDYLKSYLVGGRRRIEIEERPLMKLVNEYHNCVKETTVQPDPRPASRISIGSLVGVGQTALSYNIEEPFVSLEANTNTFIYSVLQTDYAVSRSPMIGVYADIAFPRAGAGLSLHAELKFMALKFSGDQAFSIPASNFNQAHDVSDELEIRLNKLILPLGLLKSFGSENSRFYAGAGLSLQMNVGRKYMIWRESMFDNRTGNISQRENLRSRNTYEPGLWILGGVVLAKSDLNQLSIEFRAEQSGTNIRLDDFLFDSRQTSRYKIRALSVNLAYTFWSKDSTNK